MEAHHTGARDEKTQPCQVVIPQLLGTALISVIHQVIPLGRALGKVYLC